VRRKLETFPKQVTFIFAWEATQIDQESTGGPALLQSLTMLRLASTRSDKYVPIVIAILQIMIVQKFGFRNLVYGAIPCSNL